MPQQVSGQITVTTAGTAVAGPDIEGGCFLLKANPGNTGSYCYAGNDGNNDVSSTTGYTLEKSSTPLAIIVTNLNTLYFDSDTNGDKIDWFKVDDSYGDAPL